MTHVANGNTGLMWQFSWVVKLLSKYVLQVVFENIIIIQIMSEGSSINDVMI